MRVNFLFNDGDTFDDFFELEVDWNYPVLPRLNEHLAPSFIMKLLPIALKRYHRSVVSGTIIALRAVPSVSL